MSPHEKIRIPSILTNFRTFAKEIFLLITSSVFILLTIIGNAFIGVFSTAFYYFEHGVNPKIDQYVDALWWGFATATTTGYGDITPMTMPGKLLGMALMLVGMAFFGMFTAIFAETILTSSRKYRQDR